MSDDREEFERDRLAQDGEGEVLETLDVSFEDGALKLEPAPSPGPRFGDRVRAVLPRVITAMGQWPDRPDLEALAAEIDADADLQERVNLRNQRVNFEDEKRRLSRRIEEAVERLKIAGPDFDFVDCRQIPAALAEIFGEPASQDDEIAGSILLLVPKGAFCGECGADFVHGDPSWRVDIMEGLLHTCDDDSETVGGDR